MPVQLSRRCSGAGHGQLRQPDRGDRGGQEAGADCAELQLQLQREPGNTFLAFRKSFRRAEWSLEKQLTVFQGLQTPPRLYKLQASARAQQWVQAKS